MKRGEENRSVHEAVKREKRKQKSSHPAHHLFLCRPLYRCFFFISHFYLFIYYYYFFTQVDKLGGTEPLSSETEGCL